ncbi:MAG TPA: hypothetical protein VI076_04360, partial [Actinopolymorphaceae bacterium]
MTSSNPALEFLRAGLDSYADVLQQSGDLHDPVFDESTQYGTAYHAYGNAVVAVMAHRAGDQETADLHADRARRGLDAALTHTADPDLPAAASGFSPVTGAVSRGNHRDFTWPPILKTYRLLRELGLAGEETAARIRDVDIMASFRSRPPSNWASVWLSGEWIRIREGLSPFGVTEVDTWLDAFFEQLLDVDRGFYAEPGLPNSYDLFTRFHLADLLQEGYDGRWASELTRLLDTGLARSRAVQLSDGSLASAHRSAGQTWTLGAQIAYFTHVGADDAATRAFASMRRFQRADGPFSPVENALPPSFRVGYERYTADGHYGNLALGFLATAVLGGFTGADAVPPERPTAIRVEAEPTYRAVLHAGRYSAAVDAAPHPSYDAFGVTDVTFGPDRILHFASSVRHLESGRLLNLGLDVEGLERTGPIEQVGPRAVRVTATDGEGAPYTQTVEVAETGVTVTEQLGGASEPSALLVPFLRDAGTGETTRVERTPDGIRLLHGRERVSVTVEAPVTRCVVLEYGFTNRRGLCGLVRL